MVSMKRVMIPTCLALVIVAGTSLISSRAQATRAPGQQPSASGPPPSANPLNVALPKRYPANQSTPIDGVPFDGGKQPYGVAFDGQCIWTANSGDGTVAKLRPGNGKIVGSFKVGGAPVGLTFDGANIWVTNSDDATVTKLRASDGKVLGTFAVGKQPWWLAFDGANIWVANFGDHGVTKLRASDGKNLGTFNTGGAIAVAFDGTYLWVLLSTVPISGSVTTRVRPLPSCGPAMARRLAISTLGEALTEWPLTVR